jgi:hypothetical protein
MQEGIDYVIENGLLIFTKEYHLKRGYCCKNRCRNCPWNYGREADSEKGKKKLK